MTASRPVLIGLAGKSGAGKSTVADYLERYYGYNQFAFADALKDAVGRLFRLDQEQLYGRRKEAVDPRWGKSPRWLLQWLGTEVLKVRWPDLWIRHLRQDILDFLSINGQRLIVVSDVRFRDEAEALRRMGAVLVRIERPEVHRLEAGAILEEVHRLEACATHESETGLDGWVGWDFIIRNNGGLDYLFSQIEKIVNGMTTPS